MFNKREFFNIATNEYAVATLKKILKKLLFEINDDYKFLTIRFLHILNRSIEWRNKSMVHVFS